MTTTIVYRYIKEDGGEVVTPYKPVGEYEQFYLISAAEGHLVTKDNVKFYSAIYSDSDEGWTEVVDPDYGKPTVIEDETTTTEEIQQ